MFNTIILSKINKPCTVKINELLEINVTFSMIVIFQLKSKSVTFGRRQTLLVVVER